MTARTFIQVAAKKAPADAWADLAAGAGYSSEAGMALAELSAFALRKGVAAGRCACARVTAARKPRPAPRAHASSERHGGPHAGDKHLPPPHPRLPPAAAGPWCGSTAR